MNIVQKFELADPNTKILPAHKCEACKFILFDAYRCEEHCETYCKEHLPEDSKCKICGGSYSSNQELTNKINERYKVKCINCPEEMMLEEFQKHIKEGCKEEV